MLATEESRWGKLFSSGNHETASAVYALPVCADISKATVAWLLDRQFRWKTFIGIIKLNKLYFWDYSGLIWYLGFVMTYRVVVKLNYLDYSSNNLIFMKEALQWDRILTLLDFWD